MSRRPAARRWRNARLRVAEALLGLLFPGHALCLHQAEDGRLLVSHVPQQP